MTRPYFSRFAVLSQDTKSLLTRHVLNSEVFPGSRTSLLRMSLQMFLDLATGLSAPEEDFPFKRGAKDLKGALVVVVSDQKQLLPTADLDLLPSTVFAQISYADFDEGMNDNRDSAELVRLAILRQVRPVLLIDLDNTVVDFSGKFEKVWLSEHPDMPFVHREHYAVWDMIARGMPDEARKRVMDECCEIMNRPGFFLDRMEPNPGAIEAFYALRQIFRVFVCTTPWHGNSDSAAAKMEWCRRHLQEDTSCVVQTFDKTLIHGAILVDDKPEIHGAVSNPAWTHVHYDQTYNRATGRPRIEDWSKAIPILTQVLFA